MEKLEEMNEERDEVAAFKANDKACYEHTWATVIFLLILSTDYVCIQYLINIICIVYIITYIILKPLSKFIEIQIKII